MGKNSGLQSGGGPRSRESGGTAEGRFLVVERKPTRARRLPLYIHGEGQHVTALGLGLHTHDLQFSTDVGVTTFIDFSNSSVSIVRSGIEQMIKQCCSSI